MADVTITPPPQSLGMGTQPVIVKAQPDSRFILAFPVDQATIERPEDSDSLVFTFSDGSIVEIEGFYEQYTKDNLPEFEIEGQSIAGVDFFEAFAPDIEPAAGVGVSAKGGRYTNYGDLDLMDGIRHINDLDWGMMLPTQEDETRETAGLDYGGDEIGGTGAYLSSFHSPSAPPPIVSHEPPPTHPHEPEAPKVPTFSLKGENVVVHEHEADTSPDFQLDYQGQLNQVLYNGQELPKDANGNWSLSLNNGTSVTVTPDGHVHVDAENTSVWDQKTVDNFTTQLQYNVRDENGNVSSNAAVTVKEIPDVYIQLNGQPSLDISAAEGNNVIVGDFGGHTNLSATSPPLFMNYIIDVSGSISTTELAQEKAAFISAVTALRDSAYQGVNVHLTAFSTVAISSNAALKSKLDLSYDVSTDEGYNNLVALINELCTPEGVKSFQVSHNTTNYEAAFNMAKKWFDAVNPDDSAGKNINVFISDGVPNVYSTNVTNEFPTSFSGLSQSSNGANAIVTDTSLQRAYDAFVKMNNGHDIDNYAVAVGVVDLKAAGGADIDDTTIMSLFDTTPDPDKTIPDVPAGTIVGDTFSTTSGSFAGSGVRLPAAPSGTADSVSLANLSTLLSDMAHQIIQEEILSVYNSTIVAGSGDDIVYGDAVTAQWMLSDSSINADFRNWAYANLATADAQNIVLSYLAFANHYDQFQNIVNAGLSQEDMHREFAKLVSNDEMRQYISDHADQFGGNSAFHNTGESADDLILGGAGNDRIYGQQGNDTLIGGKGDDYLVGGAEKDVEGTVVGKGTIPDQDNDILVGDDLPDGSFKGHDYYYNSDGSINASHADELAYAADLMNEGGDDILLGGAGNDVLIGGAGNDSLDGGTGSDNLYGGAGNDYLDAGAADASTATNYLDGGDGDDTLIGRAGKDTLIGGAGNDYLDGGAGNDNLYGGAGNDYLDGGAGNDNLYGGDGNDYLDAGAGDIVRATNYLDGGAGDDTLIGRAGADTLIGGDGNDYLDGGAGADTLIGGDGNDTLDGGAGNDYLDGGAGNNVVSGGAGNDLIVYHEYDTISGGDGVDMLLVDTSEDDLDVLFSNLNGLLDDHADMEIALGGENASQVASLSKVGITIGSDKATIDMSITDNDPNGWEYKGTTTQNGHDHAEFVGKGAYEGLNLVVEADSLSTATQDAINAINASTGGGG